jgi:GR25 family glycosyltransferase involved in LPS biosynthesis
MGELPVYVISLADAHVRRANMTSRLGALGIPFRFVDAIDGRTGRLPDVFDGARVSGFGAPWSIACTLSHRLLHRMIAESADEVALVLEDDAAFAPDFAEILAAACKCKFDVLKLEGGRHHRRYVPVGRIGRYSIEVGMVPSYGSAAYLITGVAAAAFCALPVINTPIDAAFGDYRLNLRVLELWPFAATQDDPAKPWVTFNNQPISTLSRLARSFRKRRRLARAHGLGMLVAMELTRFGAR